MLRGMATVTYYAEDHEAAKAWYTEFLGMAPYYAVPGYFEFRIGDYQHELGIIDARYAPGKQNEPGGEIVRWHVDDLEATLARLLELGAKEFEPITERGPGFVTATVVDPFGNLLGIMTNVHYLAVLKERS
ncbi:VOC family protein [Amycolatopsis sp. NPDC049691]|uniref:VOC family protein n=1 Tax=Amycolatopsis sp. NPDC049691 TaxID=3155155 RepID=UPI00344A72E5